jgi:hypothetical protein
MVNDARSIPTVRVMDGARREVIGVPNTIGWTRELVEVNTLFPRRKWKNKISES